MNPIRWSTLVAVLLMLTYVLYSFNTRYSENELLVQDQIQNLTQKYQIKRVQMTDLYHDKIATLQQELIQLKNEKTYQLENLEEQYQNQKYYMNTTIYLLNQMYLPGPLRVNLARFESEHPNH